VNVVGCCGISQKLYIGKRDRYKEYVSTVPEEEFSAVEGALRELSTQKEKLSREKAEREEREVQEKVAREQEKVAKERARKQAERKRQEAKPAPRIGMTSEQVINQTRWGMPYDIRRTTTASGTREQWVYDSRRYLYFDNGVLTAIQD